MSNGWNERQQRMINLLESEGEVRINELKSMFDVTEMTIRRDLEKLEQAGIARRIFGGAILLGRDIALHDRTGMMVSEKAGIGRRAAALIQPGDYVFIDGGTTTAEVARALRAESEITVVTNALNIANVLQEKKIPTIVVGGMIVEATSTLIGPVAVGYIESMAFSRVFLGTTGITVQHGFSNSNMHEAEIKKAAIRKGAEINVVADRTKFGAKGLFSFAGLENVHRIISDSLPESELLTASQEAGIEILTED